MTDLLVTYHAEDRLPGNAVALVEASEGRIDVYMSAAHSLDIVARHLGPALTAYCQTGLAEHQLAVAATG
jgi:hypothetical protein